MNYNNPIPVVVMLVRTISENGDLRYLTQTRNIEPCIGEKAFTAGYVNAGESAEQAACRELLEETGIETQTWSWKPLSTSITPNNRLLVFMYLDYLMSESDALKNFIPNEEVSDLNFARPGDTLCFPIHTEVLSKL